MELLQTVKEDAKITYEQQERRLLDVPKIPLVEARMVAAKILFAPPPEIEAGCPEIITSEPTYLQTELEEVYSFAEDLSGLHAGIIFSVIPSNSKELLGKESDTMLVRNGVTATAVCKLAKQKTVWFYHGKPMNNGDMRLHVTIGRDQTIFTYHEDADHCLYIHDGCPVSRLSVGHIGDVRRVPFYVHIYTKDKTANTLEYEGPIKICVLEIDGKGNIYESVGEDERNDSRFELVQPLELISGQMVKPAAQDHGVTSQLAAMMLSSLLFSHTLPFRAHGPWPLLRCIYRQTSYVPNSDRRMVPASSQY